jgi:DNA-binding MarR family transcriptional regulator
MVPASNRSSMAASRASAAHASSRNQRRTSYLIKRAQLAVAAHVGAAVAAFELTAAQYTLLSMLSREGGMSSAQIARRLFVTPQAITDIVAGLERRGFIARTPLAGNRRVLQAKLTSRGRRALASCERAVDDAERAVFANLHAREIATLRALLGRLLDPRA